MIRWLCKKEAEVETAETPDRSRLKFAFGLGTLAVTLLMVGCGRIPVGPEEDQPVNELDEVTTASDRIPTVIRKSARQILDEQQPGWEPWEGYAYGVGIWSIPNLVNNGLCWIYVNGILIQNRTANVDGLVLSSGSILTLTEPWLNGQVIWTYPVPYPNRHRNVS